MRARTQAVNTLFGVLIGAPSPLRDELVELTKRTLLKKVLSAAASRDRMTSSLCATTPNGCRSRESRPLFVDLAHHWKTLDEIKALNRHIEALVRTAVLNSLNCTALALRPPAALPQGRRAA